MKRWGLALFIGFWFLCSALTAFAAEDSSKTTTLADVFDQSVIIPYDFQGKAFANGKKIDLSHMNYRIVQRNGAILVPIRLMEYLATQSNGNKSTWMTSWQPQKPDVVVLWNTQLRRSITFTVNSKTMVVNNEPQTMDVAPQKINGQIVLPLRSAAVALGKKIDWLDGLIIIGDASIDLQSPQTLAIKDQIKAKLTDPRKPVTDNPIFPLTMYGDSVYYVKSTYTATSVTEKLYKQTGGQKEVQVKLNGNAVFNSAKVFGDELYFVTVVNNKAELDAYHLRNGTVRKVSSLGDWKPSDGWLEDIRRIDNDLYIMLHTGDLTMGGEKLYKVENGALRSVAPAKSFISYEKSGNDMYFTNFAPMFNTADNLSRVDLITGETAAVGEPGFSYGINRMVDEQSFGYGSVDALYVKDGYLYTLGFKENDPQDRSAVYKIKLADNTQVKLTAPAAQFWMKDSLIVYIDASTGYLESVDLDGANRRTLAQRRMMHVQLLNGNVYYLANSGVGPEADWLYSYSLATGREARLSDRSVSSYYAGKAGIYYLSEGYEPGLYRVDPDGRNTSLVKDSIWSANLTDEGIVYTLIYKNGVYSVK
ncbi:DUF5050 domain-containing protein [Paenibacillus spongiae]|uniref:DUF5050 domain-containing protein n=1 Tax=Paenibacillus spongiae TaxID=2909671 RepID=A0ABY5S763_9BACL|nr:DUF5050 domain-containing protein [Paenibacillus spongiae]UVI29420.1 DUF5050 domain-containing protein [Paenibacillus spongiae]